MRSAALTSILRDREGIGREIGRILAIVEAKRQSLATDWMTLEEPQDEADRLERYLRSYLKRLAMETDSPDWKATYERMVDAADFEALASSHDRDPKTGKLTAKGMSDAMGEAMRRIEPLVPAENKELHSVISHSLAKTHAMGAQQVIRIDGKNAPGKEPAVTPADSGKPAPQPQTSPPPPAAPSPNPAPQPKPAPPLQPKPTPADPKPDLLARAGDWSTSHAGRLVTSISETTRQELARILVDAVEKRLPFPKVVERIQKVIGEDTPGWRARMIARTESSGAWNKGKLDQLVALGFTHKTTVTNDPCPVCVHMHDAGPIPIAEPFPRPEGMGEPSKMTGDIHPPFHPNCFCSLVAAPPKQEWQAPPAPLKQPKPPKPAPVPVPVPVTVPVSVPVRPEPPTQPTAPVPIPAPPPPARPIAPMPPPAIVELGDPRLSKKISGYSADDLRLFLDTVNAAKRHFGISGGPAHAEVLNVAGSKGWTIKQAVERALAKFGITRSLLYPPQTPAHPVMGAILSTQLAKVKDEGAKMVAAAGGADKLTLKQIERHGRRVEAYLRRVVQATNGRDTHGEVVEGRKLLTPYPRDARVRISEAYLRVLQDLRGRGGMGADHSPTQSHPVVAGLVDDVMRGMPSGWALDARRVYQGMQTEEDPAQRGFCSFPPGVTVSLGDRWSGAISEGNAWHEVGHVVENSVAVLGQKVRQYWEHRTRKDQAAGIIYRECSTGLGKPDDWEAEYLACYYPSSTPGSPPKATEILSLAFEAMFSRECLGYPGLSSSFRYVYAEQQGLFLKDRGLRRFILGCMGLL